MFDESNVEAGTSSRYVPVAPRMQQLYKSGPNVAMDKGEEPHWVKERKRRQRDSDRKRQDEEPL